MTKRLCFSFTLNRFCIGSFDAQKVNFPHIYRATKRYPMKIVSSVTMIVTGAQLGEKGGRPALTLFWKSKKVSWFWKKDPNCVHLWAEFSIQNVVLRSSRRKSSKMFPCSALFTCVFWQKVYRSTLIPQNFPNPEKFLVVLLRKKYKCDLFDLNLTLL